MNNKKRIQKTLTALLAMVLIAAVLIPVTAQAAIMYNNTVSAAATFTISSSGMASVKGEYVGYSGVTTGATVEIKIQKKVLFWWSTVDDAEWTTTLYGWKSSVTHTKYLSDTGSYRAVFNFTVRGSAGSADEIEIIRYADYE